MSPRRLYPVLVVVLLAAPAAAKPADGNGRAPFQAGRTLMSVDAPCPGPSCSMELPLLPDVPDPTAKGLRTVYLAFEGVTLSASNTDDDARSNVSAIAYRDMTVGSFKTSDLWDDGGLTRTQIINQVVEDMYTLHAPYNINFTTTRPSSGAYSMIVFGGSCESVVGSSGCAGIALRDCDDYMPANITFVFPPDLRVEDLAPTAGQEAAHAFGLGHTDDRYDVMYPIIQASIIPDHFGAGNIPDDSGCGGSTFQDSDAVMLSTIGARGADTTPPMVVIDSPGNGTVVAGGTPVNVTASDNIAMDRVELWIDGAKQRGDDTPPYQFVLPATLTAGTHQLQARAFDISGNDSAAGVVVTVPGATPECQNDDDCDPSEHCSAQTCVADDPIPPPDPGELGSACEHGADCDSGLCGTVSGESLCTEHCDDAHPCPTDFECLGGSACWPVSDTGDDDDTGGGGGPCAVGPHHGAPGAGGLALLALGLLALGVKRRRR